MFGDELVSTPPTFKILQCSDWNLGLLNLVCLVQDIHISIG